jgi:hypothetical protein
MAESGNLQDSKRSSNLKLVMDEILKMKLYYQEFHHKSITWYITLMGFFIAGTIAGGDPLSQQACILKWSIILTSSVLSLLFFLCIFHYSARIERLNDFLKKGEIIENWDDQSKNIKISIQGKGSQFFLWLIICLKFIVIWLAFIKYT